MKLELFIRAKDMVFLQNYERLAGIARIGGEK